MTRPPVWLAGLLGAFCIASCRAESQTTLIEALPRLGIAEHCRSVGIEDQTAYPNHVSFLPPSRLGETRLDCVRVRIGGHFRWFDEGTATLHPNVHLAYLAWDEAVLAPRIYLGDWPDDAPALYRLNGSAVVLEGVMYNYCRAIEAAIEDGRPPEFVVELGLEDVPELCESFPLNGYLLFDVRLVSVASGEAERLRGEINRDIFGDLSRVDTSHPPYDDIAEATRQWARQLGHGEAHYLANHTPAIDRRERTFLRERPFNITDLYGDAEALRTSSGRALPEQQVAVFQYGEGDPADMAYDATAFGCICLQDDCADEWPLDRVDLPWMPGAYICTGPFHYRRDRDSWELSQ